jgi:hypothetical protein
MKAYEITFSPTGGTKKVTDLILSSFHGEKEEISVLPKDRDYTRYSFDPMTSVLLVFLLMVAECRRLP